MQIRKSQYENFGIVWTTQTTAATLIFAVPALAPLLVSKLFLSSSQIGIVVGATYVGICSVSVFFSVISDFLGVKKVLLFGHIVEAISIIGAAYAHSFEGLALATFGVGIGYSSITPVTSKAIMNWFSKEQRSSVMGLKQTGTTVGGTIAGAVLPVVGVTYGLEASFFAAGAIVIFGAVFLIGYKEGRYDDSTTFDKNARTADYRSSFSFLREGILRSLKNRDLLWTGGVGFFYASVQSVVTTYIALFAQSYLGYDAVIAGLFLSIVNISGTIARPAFGYFSDRYLGGSRIKDLLVIASVSAIFLILLSSLSKSASIFLIVPIVAVLGFGALGWNGVFLTLAGEYSDRNFEGVGTSLAFSIAMTGQIVGAPLFGLIVERSGDYSIAWTSFGIALLLASIVFTIARRKRDFANQTRKNTQRTAGER